MGDKELCLIDKNITSLLEIHLNPTITSLNLHFNQIPRIEGLASAWHLRHIDLSSNCISQIEGLGSLTFLRTLNLSCNLITKVEGLNGLVNLTRLNLSYNRINNLTGLLCLHGTEYKLKHLSLQGNLLDHIDHLLQSLLGLQGLREVTLSQNGRDNPVCQSPGYREVVMQSLQQISVLDGLNRLGNPSPAGINSPCDIPGLEYYVDLLLSSDASANEMRHISSKGNPDEREKPAVQDPQPDSVTVTDPAEHDKEQRISKLERQMLQFIQQAPVGDRANSTDHSVGTVQKVKGDTDPASESECDSGKENGRRTWIPKLRNSITMRKISKETKGKRSDSDQENRKQRTSKAAVGPKRKAGGSGVGDAAGTTRRGCLTTARTSGGVKTKPSEDTETYRTIVEERDQERERRWKAEQTVRKLTEDLRCLQTKVSEEKDLQSMALHTTDRLKDLLLKERSGRVELQTRIKELEEKWQSQAQQLEQARSTEDQHKTALRSLENSITHGEALRACQQAEEMKRHQELENKSAALKRELDIQRVSVRQHKDKLQQLHELLASREQQHRKELEMRLLPGGAEFREAVAKEASAVEEKHAHIEAELQERLAEGKKQYAALEDEFRMALTIEAARFSQVKEACDQMSAELSELRSALTESRHREKNSSSLVQELTTVVKEQKNRISELVKAKRLAVTELKNRLHSLEAEVEQDRRLSLQLELLKKDNARLLSQLTAQESLIDGLKAERKIWSQELAQQGVSLAQDRGRLEARIEVLGTELETQKKQIERDSDTLKIKVKIIEDQTETIRKLKEALQERDSHTRRLREKAVQAQKGFEKQLEEATAPLAELNERVEHLSLRKEEMREHLEDKEAELQRVRRIYGESSKKWQEKADLLTRLENQVKHMKENFESKERLLLEERDKATEAQKTAVEMLHRVDDAFRRQLESVQSAHQAQLLQLANEKQEHIEQASQRVLEVEDEMRQLLEETEANKRIIEDKMKRLTSVLKDF
ncbi:leucine-rich repeat and coiled-coil domain-containing protein 1 [Thalassophryne amazonica]|uniref:leucine-rich repeat and coiled-coil domain-containing protein 1 n=1 Tax=Thalassophryne amazonica TaxID=390379 RepID=UPI0014725D81|nr:leucine-rich repeat and coiled-coil domain-containing protein 1 [Thalassophryne amazonica]